MEKYFVPDIEDIRLGYELEVLVDSVWEKGVISKIEGCGVNIKSIPEKFEWTYTKLEGYIKVPFLMKETIKEEGWEEETNEWLGLNNKECTIGFKKGPYLLQFADYINLACSLEAALFFIRIYDTKRHYILYTGECKDINSFRTIMKLLKIN